MSVVCDFCGKDQVLVKQLVVSNDDGAAICNECLFISVGLCLLNTDKVKPATVPVDTPPMVPEDAIERMRDWYEASQMDPPYAKNSPGARLFEALGDYFKPKPKP